MAEIPHREKGLCLSLLCIEFAWSPRSLCLLWVSSPYPVFSASLLSVTVILYHWWQSTPQRTEKVPNMDANIMKSTSFDIRSFEESQVIQHWSARGPEPSLLYAFKISLDLLLVGKKEDFYFKMEKITHLTLLIFTHLCACNICLSIVGDSCLGMWCNIGPDWYGWWNTSWSFYGWILGMSNLNGW